MSTYHSAAPLLLCHFDEAREQMRLVDFIDFQNNRSSAPPIVMMDGEASVGYLLFWLKFNSIIPNL